MLNQEAKCDPQSLWGGRIQLVYSNDESNEVVVIGGAGFKTRAELDANWSRIPEHNHTEGEPWCMADSPSRSVQESCFLKLLSLCLWRSRESTL
jgi:hypothetical protein